MNENTLENNDETHDKAIALFIALLMINTDHKHE